MFCQVLLDSVRVSARLIYLVDGNNDRYIGGPGMADGLFRLRYHTVIGGNDEHHHIRHLGAARALVGHVGDSRCYRWRNGQLSQLTRDHSLLQEQLDAGLLSPEAAQHVPYRNLVTRALGVENDVALDVGEHVVSPGDLFLLCSDGLTDMLPDQAIAQLLKNSTPTDNLVQTLIDAANAAGGKDNISVILVRAVGGRPKRSLLPRWWAR